MSGKINLDVKLTKSGFPAYPMTEQPLCAPIYSVVLGDVDVIAEPRGILLEKKTQPPDLLGEPSAKCPIWGILPLNLWALATHSRTVTT